MNIYEVKLCIQSKKFKLYLLTHPRYRHELNRYLDNLNNKGHSRYKLSGKDILEYNINKDGFLTGMEYTAIPKYKELKKSNDEYEAQIIHL